MARALLFFALRACFPLLCFALLWSCLLCSLEVSALGSGLWASRFGLAGVRVVSNSNSRIDSDFQNYNVPVGTTKLLLLLLLLNNDVKLTSD